MEDDGPKPRCPASATSSSRSYPGINTKGFSSRKSGIGAGVPSPVTPTPPTSTPFLYSGTPPGVPSSEVKRTEATASPGVGLNKGTVPGPLNLLISEKQRFDTPTPTSGLGVVL